MKKLSGYIPDELYNEIAEIAGRESRKIAPMVTILLQQAVKERNRKRNAKKVRISDHTADAR